MDFEIDTGSFVSTINIIDVRQIKSAVIVKTQKKAKGYSNTVIKFLGEVKLEVEFNNTKVLHTFLVVASNQNSLLGRDLCDKLQIKMLYPSNETNHINSVEQSDVLYKYSKYLSNEFKSDVKQKVVFDVKPDIRPIFCKSRSVPLKHRELVKKELSRLEDCGIITKVFNSKWAAPTVNVLKSNNTIRVCGDYSLTINKCMDTVQYPLPSVNDVIMRMGILKYSPNLIYILPTYSCHLTMRRKNTPP